MGEVQKAFNLKKEGAFRISVKNPHINTPVPGGAGTGLEQKADFPEECELPFPCRYCGENQNGD